MSRVKDLQKMAGTYDENQGYMEQQELRRDFDEWGNPLPSRDTSGYMEYQEMNRETSGWEDMGR